MWIWIAIIVINLSLLLLLNLIRMQGNRISELQDAVCTLRLIQGIQTGD